MVERMLSIVVPAYNEERFIGALLEKILAVDLSRFGLSREIIVVDDGSTDRSVEIASRVEGVRVVIQDCNRGKGAAVRRGIAMARGEFIVIQDADLEYDPGDYLAMLETLLQPGVDAVYGSRYLDPRGAKGILAWLRSRRPGQSWGAYLGGRSLSLVGLLFSGHYLTDTVTALKMFRRDTLRPLDLRTSGFETDHEITAKILARGMKIREVPVFYSPRSKTEGKKIGLRDWFSALATFRRFRRG